MNFPSLTTILGVVFVAYIIHSIYTMSRLFVSLKCSSIPCYTSFLESRPRMQLALFTSHTMNPISSEVKKIYSVKNFEYWNEFQREFEIDVPLKTRRNGTLFMQVVLALEGEPLEWKTLRRDGPTVIHTVSLTDYQVPRAEAYNLLGENKQPDSAKSKVNTNSGTQNNSPLEVPVSHIFSNIYVGLLIDNISLSHSDVPPEIARLVRINRYGKILPILKTDYFNTRLKDLVQVTKNMTEFKANFSFRPMGIGKLRLMLMIEHAMNTVQTMGFSKKDVEDVKGIFSDANLYLLCCTVAVAGIHIFFDFLSFKNDIAFWRKKTSYEGLSARTTLWRAFSQIVVFLYLMDENTSMLVLVPAGVAMVIEIWKCKKILKLQISLSGIRKQPIEQNSSGTAEKITEEFDKQGMRYLSYLLYPLCIAGAIYSLLYQPHRSWSSWTLNSLVNGVYAFGFLFMLPQLFVNYKLKSVAALPWRALLYKFVITFIDDFFAFIITMPTAHRVACLRDDVVFLIYLYQRWLYPVDKNRVDADAASMGIEGNQEKTELTSSDEHSKQKTE